jgi:hypothetical protein
LPLPASVYGAAESRPHGQARCSWFAHGNDNFVPVCYAHRELLVRVNEPSHESVSGVVKRGGVRSGAERARSDRGSFARYTSPIPPAPSGERIS